MTINDQIRDEKLQFDINREAAKILELSPGKIHKYEYLTGEDILPPNQQQIIEQAKFTYSPLGKVFGKQIKTIKVQGEKQAKALENLRDQEKQVDNIRIIKISYYTQKNEKFLRIFEKRVNKIEDLTKTIDGNNLIFNTLSKEKQSILLERMIL